MLLVLTCAAGLVDAISYLEMGHVFTAMMTGNTVLLALAIGQGEVMAALRSTLALIAFSVGAAAGAMVLRAGVRVVNGRHRERHAGDRGRDPGASSRRSGGTRGGRRAPTSRCSCSSRCRGCAMGIQAAAVRHLGVPGVASTYITGTLTSLMAELVTGSATRHLRLLASVFLVYGAGALIGTVLQARSSSLLAWLPFAAWRRWS